MDFLDEGSRDLNLIKEKYKVWRLSIVYLNLIRVYVDNREIE
jgi:hypothetical protein